MHLLNVWMRRYAVQPSRDSEVEGRSEGSSLEGCAQHAAHSCMKLHGGSKNKCRKRRLAWNLTAKSRLQHQAVKVMWLQSQNNGALASPLLPCFLSSDPCHGPWKEVNARRFSVQCVFLLPLSPCLAKLKFLLRNRRCRGHENRRRFFIGELVVNHGHRCWKAPTAAVTFLVAEATQV